MEYTKLAQLYQILEETTSRIKMTQALVDLFKETPPELIDKVVYLSIGRIAPEYTGLDYNFSEKSAIKALSTVLNISEHDIQHQVLQTGDLGDAGKKLYEEKGVKPEGILTVEEVYRTLREIAQTTGYGSTKKKLQLFTELLKKASPLEVKYLLRTITERLRLGIGDNTIMDALSIAFTGKKENREIIERAYNISSDLGYVARILAEKGLDAVKNIKIEIGRPIRPMLAERMAIPSYILKKLGGKAGAEYKYDGERIQVHRKGDTFYLFSRRLENITDQFPDLIEFLKESIPEECIIELEAVVIDPSSGAIRPFQDLMNRRVKYVTRFHIMMYPIAGFIFDIMYLNGEDLTLKPYPERRKILEENIKITERINLSERKIVDNVEDLESFFHQAIEDGCEGLVCKSLQKDSIYQAGKRGFLWIKYKRDYKSHLADTLDLVVVGAFYGKGARTGYFGSLLMACYDPETDQFKTVCKVGTGFKEDDFKKLDDLLKEHTLDHKHPRVNSILSADIWYEPFLVLEITGAELTLSPVHTCGWDRIKINRGLGLRFPRFTGRYRFDKRPEDATTEEEIINMYKNQIQIKS
ncbi:MAG TPA: DNA ligase [Persephonella sp.]|uniref:Probable DNA ligase n=1 Tax=Persephonella marina (strain DSM 14350 / EX-H1) TaxID=123214 RepID=DNLI_PERMH|nr:MULTISPECIES: ATP-dependent DNA ligase [Persephonella]C0QSL7.1 RecName: Full=Probable DNA ligase; AltName: Full=Polydeoxyribonucleotide synthase [ATP] [Persephonella marina EX-H1]ACO03229.1 DNA ligase (Polydeoxyribonucleotide synthase [ATP])(Lig(Tk)) [Persephonella marina EX-H1]HCB69410.1 DNA ligase [Persephonella sp.]